MDLHGYLRFLRRWWWLLLLGPVLAATPTYFWTKQLTPTYQATTIIFVNQSAVPNSVSYNDALLNQQLVKTYSQIAQQPVILAEASRRLGYPITGSVTAQTIPNTQLFSISAVGSDPIHVRDITDTVAFVFITRQEVNLPADQSTTSLQVVQPALIPGHPTNPKLWLNLAAAVSVGLALSISLGRVLMFLDDTIKSPDDLEQAADLLLLGSVDSFKGYGRRKTEILALSRRPAAEAYRRVRAGLRFALRQHRLSDRGALFDKVACQIIIVTSAKSHEGKSTTVANLATIMTQGNTRVLIIDADLRRPMQCRIFGLAGSKGFSDLLLGDSEAAESYIIPTRIKGLRLLPSGPALPDSAAAITSSLVAQLLEQLRDQADIILIDSPPVLETSDALEISECVDGIVLVVDATKTRAPQVRAATEALERSGTRILGAVLNKLSKHQQFDHDSYYDGRLRHDVTSAVVEFTASDIPSAADHK